MARCRVWAGSTLGAIAGLLAFANGASASAHTACTALSGTMLTLDGVAQTLSLTAIDVSAGSISKKPRSPAFCEINAVVSSNANAAVSRIAIAVWLPETGWNGRFLGTGNGGFAGVVRTGPMKTGLLQFYAVANTDLGTGILFKCITLFCGSREGFWQFGVPLGGLLGDSAAIDDFGYGATHLMTLAGKQLIEEYYGTSASYSYFHGCSTGGGQALGEAQLYPADYDGILAGSPAYNRTHLITGRAAEYEVTHFAPDAYLTDGALALAHAGVLAACAGQDGGLPTDDFLTKPALCKFNAAALQCSGAPGELPCDHPVSNGRCTCLTADEAVSMNQYWAGSFDNHGNVVDPGYERSAETGTDGFSQLKVTEPAYDSLDYWSFGLNFHWQSLFRTVSAPDGIRAERIRALDGTPVGSGNFDSVLNARNADLAAFHAQGGKLILYAGYADPAIPSADTIDYYNQAVKDDPQTPEYVRLYLAPGMWHCDGGPGVDAFGNESSNQPPRPKSPDDDVLAALVAWRENGAAPGKIIGTHYINDAQSEGIAFQRPLCPYPQNARYKGRGEVNLARSFRCAPGDPVRSQKFGKGYGPY
jgi:feruloyl esterase